MRSTRLASGAARLFGASLLVGAGLLLAAAAPPGRDNVVGEAASVGPERRLVVKRDGGGEVAVSYDEKTAFLRAQPGATTLDAATPVQPQEIAAGDRLLCRGTLDAAGTALAATRVVVMARGDLEARRRREREDWQRRGIAGLVTAVDPLARRLKLRVAAPADAGATTVVVEAGGEGVRFRRYAPSSVRFDDARPGTFSELEIGDQARVLGERSADGARVTAEQVVSGAFRVVRGSVAGIDAAKGTLSVRTNGKPALTVAVGPRTLLRRLPPMLVMRLLRANEGGPQARPSGAAPRPQAASGGAADPDEALERLPAITLAQIQDGDEVAVLGPKQSEAGAWPAIKLAAWTMPTFPSGGRGGGRGEGSVAGGADAFSDVLGLAGEPW